MFYYLLATFLILVAFCAHIILAHIAYSLLEEFSWFKKPYKKYLLVPGVAEAVLGIFVIVVMFIFISATISSFFED
jgi:ABC-type phosphate transport system permease subunit